MDSLPVTKRKRIEAEERKPLVRSENLWFEDGNIILQTDTVEFKVHRSVLSKNSTCFRELVASEGTDEDQRVSATVVLAHSGVEVHELLNAVYNGSYLLSYCHKNNRLALSFSAVSALVRLGHKYGFIKLRDEAAQCLYKEFPCKLSNWLRTDRSKFRSIQIGDLNPSIVLFEALMLAISCRILTIQVSIYLDIFITVDLGDIRTGVQDSEGLNHKLPADVQLVCLFGFETLRTQIHDTTYKWLTLIPSPTCTKIDEDKRMSCKQVARKRYMSLFGPDSPKLHGLEDWDECWAKKLCSHCAETARSQHIDGRQQLWERLPSFFELQGWEDLTNFEDSLTRDLVTFAPI